MMSWWARFKARYENLLVWVGIIAFLTLGLALAYVQINAQADRRTHLNEAAIVSAHLNSRIALWDNFANPHSIYRDDRFWCLGADFAGAENCDVVKPVDWRLYHRLKCDPQSCFPFFVLTEDWRNDALRQRIIAVARTPCTKIDRKEIRNYFANKQASAKRLMHDGAPRNANDLLGFDEHRRRMGCASGAESMRIIIAAINSPQLMDLPPRDQAEAIRVVFDSAF